MLPFFLRCVHGNGIKNVAIAASTIRSTSNMRHEQTRADCRACACKFANAGAAHRRRWPRSGNSSGAMQPNQSSEDTKVKLLKERGTHRYILPSLFAHKIHILRRKQHALRRVKNFVDHVVSEATPFSPSQPYTLSRPPSGVCKLCRARAEITFERTASPDDIRLPRKLGIFNSAI